MVPLLALTLGQSCVSRNVDIVPFLAPTRTATLDELVAHINQWEQIRSLVLRIDLQFVTVVEAGEGAARRFRTAQGRLLLARPQRIRLDIEAPILSASIAEMASDGERFQLLIYPADYRALIQGRNDRTYDDESAKLDEDPDLQKAGPLVNIRPQHLTDAFLLTTIPIEEPNTVAFLEEERVDERDTRPRAKTNSFVRKSYYVVTTARLGEDSARARYWFDRTDEISLTRQQVYGPDGRLVADIRYSDYLPPHGDTAVRIASRVEIDRPYDDYVLVVTVKPDGVTINRDLPDTAFVVTAPEAWGDNVRRIDLDERHDTSSR
jgi:hypothetical protein